MANNNLNSIENANINNKESSKFNVKIKDKTTEKIGLFSAVMIIFGAMIGIGIFLKNGSVFKNNNGNPYGILISWIIVILIAICTAYSFGEISRIRVAANAGLGGWSSRYVGERFGRFVKLTYPLMCFSIILLCMTMFFSELIFKIKYGENHIPKSIDFWYVILTSFGLTILLILFCYFCENILVKCTNILGIVKFIPIILFLIGALWAFAKNIQNNMFIPGQHISPGGDVYSGDFTIFGVFNSLPAIMFALDGFLIVGNISGKVNNPTKNVSISIIISMSIACILYLILTVAQILSCCPDIYQLFAALFGSESLTKTILTYFLSAFMTLSIFNTCLSIVLATIKSFEYSVNQDLLFGTKWLKRKLHGNTKLAGLIYLSIMQLFYYLLITIASGILQSDILVDGISNIVIMTMFIIYGIVALSSAINHFTKKIPTSEVSYQKGQVAISIISFIGCIFIPCWTLGWTFMGDPISDAIKHISSNFNGWGLFYENDPIQKWIVITLFWSILIFLIALPFINDLLIKCSDRNYSHCLLWQKLNNNK